MATVCSAISFFVIILAVSISGGFRREIRAGLSVAGGDVKVIPVNMDYLNEANPILADAAYREKIDSLPYVSTVNPVIYRAGIVKEHGTIHGVVVKGVENGHPCCPSTGGDAGEGGSLAVSIPSSLASVLSLSVGDPLPTYFIGERIQVRKFVISDIYTDAVDSRDLCVVYAPIETLRRLNRWSEAECSALEITLVNPSESAIEAATGEIGMLTTFYNSPDNPTVYATNVIREYPQIFDWLRLVDFNVAIVLLIMIIVAGFNMISGLLIILFENISTIGLLKALGMNDKGIAKVFLSSSGVILAKGLLAGNGAALLVCLVQHWTHVLKLNPANYFVDHVPVALNLPGIFASDIVAFALIMAMLLIPTMFISKVDPARSLKVE